MVARKGRIMEWKEAFDAAVKKTVARMRRWKKRSCLVVRKASNTGTLNTVGISTYLQKRPESQNRNSLKL